MQTQQAPRVATTEAEFQADRARYHREVAEHKERAAAFIAERMTVQQIEHEIEYRRYGSGSMGLTGADRPKFERALEIKAERTQAAAEEAAAYEEYCASEASPALIALELQNDNGWLRAAEYQPAHVDEMERQDAERLS